MLPTWLPGLLVLLEERWLACRVTNQARSDVSVGSGTC